MVVAGAVVVVATVVVGALVVVGLGALVVCGAVVAGRVVGGAGGVVARGAEVAGTGAGWVELVVVLGSSTVVSGVPKLVPPAATATVVEVGLGAFPGSPNACRARTRTIPAVATPVATHGRRNNDPASDPVDSRARPFSGSATLPPGGLRPGPGR